jgi:glutamine cyclotransferase
MKLQVLNELPHPENGHCQGLILRGNTIYESCGGRDKSYLACYRLGEDKYYAKAEVHRHFAEGIALLDGVIYQGTLDGVVLVYHSLRELIGAFQFGVVWGMTSDGFNLWYSDSGSILRRINVKTYKVDRVLTTNLPAINDFCLWNDWFVCCSYASGSMIYGVNRNTGEVEFEFQPPFEEGRGVLNGICKFDDKSMLVTGKEWSKIYRIGVVK